MLPDARFVTRWIGSALAVLTVVALVTGSASAAPAPGQSVDTAIPISVSASPTWVWGTLGGNTGGSYAYYVFDNAYANQPLAVTIHLNSKDADVANAVGLVLWDGWGARVADVNALSDNPGTNSRIIPAGAQGPVIIQLYNYSPLTVDYAVSLTLATK